MSTHVNNRPTNNSDRPQSDRNKGCFRAIYCEEGSNSTANWMADTLRLLSSRKALYNHGIALRGNERIQHRFRGNRQIHLKLDDLFQISMSRFLGSRFAT